MKNIPFYSILLLAVFLLLPTGLQAEVITLSESSPATGPAKGTTADYKFIVPRDGVLSISTTFTGAYWGTFSVAGENHTLSSSVIVKEGDVALITVTCEEDNTTKTIMVTLTDVSEGMTAATAANLHEGNNSIEALKSGDIPMWYKFTVPAQKRSKLTVTGYPTLLAYVGEDLATELGQNNPVDYINTSDKDVDIYVRISSTNSQELTATLEYLSPVADLTYFNSPAFSVANGGNLPKGEPLTITFPNRQGGDDSDEVIVSYYIFNVVGSNPNGAPVNLGGETEAKGTLAGVDINYNFTKGRKYQLKIQSLKCGNHYAPSAEEPMINGDAVIFTVTTETGIEVLPTCDGTAPAYSIAGQKVSTHQKGIVICNGRKILK